MIAREHQNASRRQPSTCKCACHLERFHRRQPVQIPCQVWPRVVESERSRRLTADCRIPLNDDAQEKAARLQNRQALHDLQLNQIRAAASPMRKLNGFTRAASSSPQSQSGPGRRNARPEDGDDGLAVMGSSVISPVKRVPILANFEEWMKLATDNVRRHSKSLAGWTDDGRKSTRRTRGILP